MTQPKPEPGTSEKPASSTLKIIIFTFLVITLIFAFQYTSIGSYFTREFIESALTRMGAWAPFGFVLFYTLATTIGVPGTILTIIGGILFGPYMGTFLVVFGATFGASGAFLVSRFMARDFVADKFSGASWFKRLDDGIAKEGLYFILFIRLVPVFPFNGINFASGLTKISFRHYFLGTAVGIIPGSFIFVNAASKAATAASEGAVGPGLILSIALLAGLILVPVIYKKYKTASK